MAAARRTGATPTRLAKSPILPPTMPTAEESGGGGFPRFQVQAPPLCSWNPNLQEESKNRRPGKTDLRGMQRCFHAATMRGYGRSQS